MQDAMDETQCAHWLTRLIEGMPDSLRAHLLPLSEQLRRNARALVFVPAIHVRPTVLEGDRLRVIAHIRDQLQTGNFNHNAGLPRARWELSDAQRPVNRLLALVHRLREGLTRKDPALTKWKVQPRGTSAELWSLHDRPLLVFVVNSANVVVQSSAVGKLTAEGVEKEWAQVLSPAA